MSYVAVIHAAPGKRLLGDEAVTRSSRFGRRADAEIYRVMCTEANGPRASRSEIEESPQPPEIFPHCHYAPAQAIGGICSKCRQRVTAEDALWFREETPTNE